ncbi:MAG TPA: ATP-binding protein [Vicinamibacterales bacterium]|nr:ATP-binding protein [Vicinamibacterales bacterium]
MRSLVPFRSEATEADVASRLALVEQLLASVDVGSSARAALDWLAAHTAIGQALVLAVDETARQLALAAETGLAADALVDFAEGLDDPGHPLAGVLTARAPVWFETATAGFRPPFDAPRFIVFPLGVEPDPAPDCEPACGLLVAATGEEPGPGVRWLTEVLGRQLWRLRSKHRLARTRYGRERALLHSLIDAVSDALLLTDPDGRILVANAQAERLFHAPENASEGWQRAVSLNSMLFSAALSAAAVDGQPPGRRELLLADPVEGSDLLFEHIVSPAADEHGGRYLVSVLRDVTDLARVREQLDRQYRELRAAQAEVREERQRLRLIIDSVADPIVVTDQAGDILLLNAPAERLFAAPADVDEAVQRRVHTNGAHFTAFVSRVLTAGGEERLRGTLSLVDPITGEPKPMEGVAGAILSEQKELTWIVTILHDLTEALERERLYEQIKRASVDLERKVQEATAELVVQNELLRRQALELEQASALKSQFLANISHEFRTPLNAILGYTHMLLRGVSGEISEAQRRSLARIDSNSRHLLALINDILDISRIEAGRMPLRLSSFRLPPLVQEVVAELEPILARSKLRLVTRIPARLPALRSDRQKVKQILLNLLSNAFKFTPEGSVTVSASYRPSDRTIAIAVKDTGIGIAPEHQAKVFEDFRQLESSSSRTHGGTGLGLAICRRLATMLDGRIELKSELGKGSTFTLRLPLRPRKP